MSPNPKFPTDLGTVTEEILTIKLYFLCSEKKAFVSSNSVTLSTFFILATGGIDCGSIIPTHFASIKVYVQ